MLSVPLKPAIPMTARSLAEMIGATIVIRLDEVKQEFVGWTPDAPDDGFSIEGGKGYIVNIMAATRGYFRRGSVDESDPSCGSTGHAIERRGLGIRGEWTFEE